MSRLLVVHNLSENKLTTAVELGGFPAPSLAIIKDDTGLNDYGEISLVMGDKFDIKKFPTFRSDVYSQRAPRAKYEVDSVGLRQVNGAIQAFLKERGIPLDVPYEHPCPDLEAGLDYYVWGMVNSESVSLAYAYSKGIDVPLVYEDVYAEHDFFKHPHEAMNVILSEKLYLAKDGSAELSKFNACAYELFCAYHEKKKSSPFKLSLKDEAKKYFSINNGSPELYFGILDRFVTYINDAHVTEAKEIDRWALKHDLAAVVRTEDVESWVQELAQENGVFHSPFFYDVLPGSEEDVKRPYTLDNLVNYVSKKIRGAEDFYYGAGTVRSIITDKIDSIDEAISLSDRIVNEDDFKTVGEALSDKMRIFAELMSDGVGSFSSANNLILDYAKDGDRAALQKYVNTFLPDAFFEELDRFFCELNDAPTAYFESKPLQPIYLSDFDVAIVPDDISQSAESALASAGLTIKHYPALDKSARLKLLSEPDVPSLTRTMQVKQDFNVDLPAPRNTAPAHR